ncbi:hypothetical protein O6H91_22G053600 [Diphasiastrum complanatum]|uniref:Uncharacterized protein n=1 Tax=Diphasiastrum complanatum TaxID=34168 RepID=A0ACC2AHA4_DIPCM|nr:hypothetical protein O6H91_22G053600 [Diphasiastrum complanatum]
MQGKMDPDRLEAAVRSIKQTHLQYSVTGHVKKNCRCLLEFNVHIDVPCGKVFQGSAEKFCMDPREEMIVGNLFLVENGLEQLYENTVSFEFYSCDSKYSNHSYVCFLDWNDNVLAFIEARPLPTIPGSGKGRGQWYSSS